jgi:hypothetical protein
MESFMQWLGGGSVRTAVRDSFVEIQAQQCTQDAVNSVLVAAAMDKKLKAQMAIQIDERVLIRVGVVVLSCFKAVNSR